MTRPAYDPRDSRSTGNRAYDDNPYPPSTSDPYGSRSGVRNANSQRVIANGVDRRPAARSSDAVDREALRMGHNTGAGGNPFAIPNGSRDDRTPPPRRNASSTTTPEPWRGNDRGQGQGDAYFPRDLPGDFDGPDIRPRTKASDR